MRVTHLIEEASSFLKYRALLLKLTLPLAELFPALVHFAQPSLVVLEPIFQLIERVLCPRSDGGERRDGRKRWDTERGGEGLDLGLEQAKTSGRFCQSTESGREWPLEGRDVRVELEVRDVLHRLRS